MNAARQAQVAPAEVRSDLSFSDLAAALSAGWSDLKSYPAFGLFFAGFYVAAGILLFYVLSARDALAWLVPATAGFPLFAPFIAVGLYEVSRRREAGLPMSWGAILGALRGRGDEQILSMGVIVFVAFAFWLMVAHGIFAIFLGESGIGTQWIDMLTSAEGLLMLVVGSAVGGIMALAFFAITVMSLPMLVDRDVDFISAIIVSLAVVRSNKQVIIGWAMIIAVTLFLALIPLFLGLLIVLPLLGHATWHLYRRAVPQG